MILRCIFSHIFISLILSVLYNHWCIMIQLIAFSLFSSL